MINESFDRTYTRSALNTTVIEVEIQLSQDAHVVQNFKNYSLADLLVELGGMSRSFYFIGMFCAHFVSKMIYRKSLIEDLFMWQKP